jgi:membrane-associated protein
MGNSFIEIFLHIDKYLNQILIQYNTAAYILLFIIIFMETGFVITPFLPGDSLLFATGAVAAVGGPISIPLIIPLFYLAAIGGDTVNYHIGRFLKDKVKRREHIPLVKMEYIDRTHAFFARHGGKTITLARFVPIIRTFAPFVAGVGEMSYRFFIYYNIIGGISWVTALFLTGYFFGNIGFIRNHFSFVVLAIVFISIIPILVSLINARVKKHKCE